MTTTTQFISTATLSLLICLSSPVGMAQEKREFFDDFQGQTLSPAFRVLNPDRQRMALTQDEFLLLVAHKDKKNVIEYNGLLPENYVVTIRLAGTPSERQQGVQIRIGDASNNVRVGVYVDYYKSLYQFTNKTLDNEDAKEISIRDDGLLGEPLYLKFTKTDVEFEGASSPDGVQWSSLGKQVLIDPSAKVNFEVYGWGDAPESPIKIDSFEIVDITN
ncbi:MULTISPECIES: hypothetical protein [unclassified Ruegeria]|uniref:hypothetical protein n=1 Tax=unclassified Ruegeria TaxID=2625375 RepID=UPI001490FD18|nr:MULTISPECIES: hypothetical protein [unclassified Ruegeria]NOD33512.1 hypothetical protein [Ruegeria sp. HKCCD7296]NOD45694.1 hypothetical protein [Ruegeria sp. HKCCD5849]NOD51006.1 hypothetical protein [Ruegeria sp. HKCCD5851]NOD67813.1 hypothetical protein [Ruegeria sp. HKCCD7303]NOE40813.1 hypothetical protein [Ruegeria sp. HKCCD7319]